MSELIDRALELYQSESLAVRAYLRLRRRLLPLAHLDAELPRAGRILDLACGHGLVTNLLALGAPSRELLGIDLDASRIVVAERAGRSLANARFEAGDLTDFQQQGLRGIVLIDTLHYLQFDQQREVLARCRRALVAGGTLIVRDAVRERSLRFAWNYAHEAAMVGGAFTATRGRCLNFQTRAELLALVEASGFVLRRVDGPSAFLPYTDTLIVAEKRAAGLPS